MDDEQQVVVRALATSRVDLGTGVDGLVVWADGERDRWQFFTGTWERPSRASAGGFGFDFAAHSRGSTAHSAASLDTLQSTILLAQLRAPPVTRGPGSIVTPYEGSLLLGPRITFRRESGNADEPLSAVEATLRQSGTILLSIRFPEGATRVRWDEIENLPENLKTGLLPGAYEWELGGPTGTQRAAFVIAEPAVGEGLLAPVGRLAELLPDDDPLAVQVAVEELISHRPPLLVDASDQLERLPEAKLTQRLKQLRHHVHQRLQDPGQRPLPPQPTDEPTGDPAIDAVRSLIAASRWEEALEELDEIEADDSPEGRRRTALAQLYRGVILGESGPAKEEDTLSAFRAAILTLTQGSGTGQDRYRAHHNLCEFLLGRATDRLHNHAFQIAAGVRLPLLSSLQYWLEARRHAELALAVAQTQDQKSVVKLALARQYVLLADIVQTLGDPAEPTRRFEAAEKGARAQAVRMLHSVIGGADPESQDQFLLGVAQELLAQIAFRGGDEAACIEHADRALEWYRQAGSLAGCESIYRLRGDARSGSAATNEADRESALTDLLVSHRLAELLRQRIPTDQVGLGRAGFLSRRAYVNEKLVELLIGRGRYKEALFFVELAKARALQDVLTINRVQVVRGQDTFQMGQDFLADWPSETAALEYFLGSERAWVFLVTATGEVHAHPIRDEGGQIVASLDLIRRIRRLIEKLDHLGPVEGRRIAHAASRSGRATFEQTWQHELHWFYNALVPVDCRSALESAQTVVIIPHNLLHYFPFAALVTVPDANADEPTRMPLPQFFVEEPFSLVHAPSLLTWRLLTAQPQRPLEQVNIVGIVDFGGRAGRLNGVQKEITNMRRIFGARIGAIATERDATESAVRKMLTMPGILSISTHGQKVPDRPLEAYLICQPDGQHDGYLQAAKIYELSVESDLVLLNACYGGFADRAPLPGDDLLGIQRALLHSGARTVVSGIWDVYDVTAPDIMEHFWQHIASGLAASEALSHAQRAYLHTWRQSAREPLRFLTHPYYWAVFTVAGDHRTGTGLKVAASSHKID